jgi:uncharacterized membrane protein
MDAANKLTVEGWGAYSVIAVSFEEDGNAYSALTLLKELDAQRRLGIEEAAVVVRSPDGRVVEKDRVESMFMPATLGWGLIGLLIGIIGGPFGILLGGASGVAFGSLFDLHDIEETDSVLGEISSSVRAGHPALLAVVTEQSPDVIDAEMAGLGGTVLRRSVSDVEAEIAAAKKARRKAKLEAEKELLRGRRERDKQAVHAKVDELKTQLHRGHKATSPGG